MRKSSTSFIYKITNIKNNKSYIGVTSYAKPIRRWKKHILISKNKTLYMTNGSFRDLHQAILDFGAGNFTFEVLEECPKRFGFKREQYWIKFHNTFGDGGYNKTAGGRGFNGRTHSAETKEKLSDLNKGKYSGADNPFYGQHHTEETKAKISAANKKKAFNRGENNPFYGKKHSEETIALMKEKAKAREYKQEWVLKRIKLSKDDVVEIKKDYGNGVKVTDLAEKYKVSIPCIYKVLKKTRATDQEQ
jgi:group I intron endonuclease